MSAPQWPWLSMPQAPLSTPQGPFARRDTWQPPVDVYETPNGWLVKCELAGVAAGDVQVDVAGSQVVIRGARRDVHGESAYRMHLLEIAYSQFERRIPLPRATHVEQEVAVEMCEGMLLVRIVAKEPGR